MVAAAIAVTILEQKGCIPLSENTAEVSDNLVVNFIDVGQGDCIYLSADGENMLIDCGEASEAEAVLSYLDKLGVKRLDYVVATHPHSDHMGGMSEIVEACDIGEVIMPYLDDGDIPTTRYFEKFLEACDEKGIDITDAEVGATIGIGDAQAKIIAPSSRDYGNANNYSVGILLSHGSNDFIFTGDAEALAEEEMIESGMLKEVEVYKVGHHGSDTSSSEEFLEVISPEYAVVMCGEGNSYGHPHDEIVERIREYTDEILRTDLCGSIVIESDGNELEIRTER